MTHRFLVSGIYFPGEALLAKGGRSQVPQRSVSELKHKQQLISENAIQFEGKIYTASQSITVLPMASGRRGRASVPTVTPMEMKGLPPTVAILPTSTSSMPGSSGLLSKTRPFPLPLSQQKGALYSISHGQIQLCLHC